MPAFSFRDQAVATWRERALSRALAVATLALIAVTWRLWIPQNVFPQVPLLRIARFLPTAVEWLALAAVAGSLGIVAFWSAAPRGRRALAAAVVGLALLAVADQHRLQPWTYQAMLLGLVLAACPTPRAFTLARWLTISIYFYSGVSKLDYTFLHGLGQQFLGALLGLFGQALEGWSPAARVTGAALLPLGELLVAAGLAFGRTRRLALVSAIGLHASLLLVLSPLGLNHSLGVLLWNAWFIAQNVLLFGATPPDVDGAPSGVSAAAPHSSWGAGLAQAILLAALVLPLAEPWGWFDVWPSWALYAPNSERLVVRVHRRALESLAGLEAYAVDADENESWVRLRTDRWSLDALAAPLYPQNRFQLGVAEALGRHFALDHWIEVVVLDRADRYTGERSRRTLHGVGEISAAATEYLLGAAPNGRFEAGPPPPR